MLICKLGNHIHKTVEKFRHLKKSHQLAFILFNQSLQKYAF